VEQVCSTDANDELVNGVLFFWLGCLISVGIHECFLTVVLLISLFIDCGIIISSVKLLSQ
jgi:hypothetical protein